MRELPILFNTEMVQAILNGRKTCTRRVVKGYIPKEAEFGYTAFTPKGTISCRGIFETDYPGYGEKFFKLPYQRGDVLYVRETWSEGYEEGTYIYKADDKLKDLPEFKNSSKLIYHPSIYMPKKAARIWLKVTGVRVERLQEITEIQAQAEGCNSGLLTGPCSARGQFENLWNRTIKKSDLDIYGWEENPWVWVIEFERCEKPLECILEGYDKAPNDGSEKCLGYMYDNSDTLLPMCAECQYQASYESEE